MLPQKILFLNTKRKTISTNITYSAMSFTIGLLHPPGIMKSPAI